MQTITKKSEKENLASKPAVEKVPDIVGASVLDTLAALHGTPDIGLMGAEVDARRKR